MKELQEFLKGKGVENIEYASGVMIDDSDKFAFTFYGVGIILELNKKTLEDYIKDIERQLEEYYEFQITLISIKRKEALTELKK
jgi:hypothetical protein